MTIHFFIVSAWQKRKRGAEKLEKKCPTNPFSSASSEAKCGWLKRDQAHTHRLRSSCTTHHYWRPRSCTKKAWRSTVPPLPCAFSLFIIWSFQAPFFLLSFLGSRRATAAQIVNALVGQKKADLAHIKRIQRHQLQLRIELKPEKIRSLGINE